MVTWHSFDLRTGVRGQRVLTQTLGTIGRTLSEATSTSLAVSCYDSLAEEMAGSNGPAAEFIRPGWDESTMPGSRMLVALDGEDERILWGGWIARRESDQDDWVTCSMQTLEGYLDRRFAGDLTYTGEDQATIAAGLVDSVNTDGLNFTIDAPASGYVRDRAVKSSEDKTILSVLTEMESVENGIEYTVDLEWVDGTHTQIRRVFRIRNRIGTALAYPSKWSMPGCVTEFSLVEDYSSDNGGNDVVATSSGEDSARPTSVHQTADVLLDSGQARFELRFSPGENITDQAVLDSAAAAKLALIQNGGLEFTLKAKGSAAPVMNSDWWLGDDILAVLTCRRFPAVIDQDGIQQPGYQHRTRAVGWEWDLDGDVLTPAAREV